MKQQSVTIATSILNEEDNIKNLLGSLSAQKTKKYYIKEIIIISDGSTDTTNDIVQSYKSPYKLVFVKGKKRLGKTQRLNEILQMAKGEYIVLIDGDIVIPSIRFIESLMHSFTDNVAVVGANTQPLAASSLVELSVNASFEIYDHMRTRVRNGNNPHTCIGRALAITRQLAQEIEFPKETIGNDAYIYFSAISRGYKYNFSPDAVVYYRSPNTLQDQTKQLIRYEKVSSWMKKYFNEQLINEEYRIPLLLLVQSVLTIFMQNPIGVLSICIMNSYIRLRHGKQTVTSLWPVSLSSKKVIRLSL